MRIIRRLALAIFAVVVVAVGALFFLPGERIAQIAADQIEARTGRAVLFSGETEVTWWPVLGVRTGAVQVANADWSKNGPMFRAEALTIGVDASALISGNIRVKEVLATKPEILLERSADGRANWQIGSAKPDEKSGAEPAPEPEAESEAQAFQLDRARITGAALHLIDAQSGTRQSFDNVDISLDWPEASGPVDLKLVLRPAGQDVQVDGQISDVTALIAGEVSGVTMQATTGGGTLSFAGRAGSAPEAQGQITADLSDSAAFLAALGVAGVEVPKGLGQQAKFSGDVTLTRESKLSLRDAKAALDGNQLTLAADATLSGKPVVKAQIVAGALDLSGLSSGGTAASGDAAAAPGWSTAPIDASALGLFDGEISLSAESLKVADLSFGKLGLVTTVERSRAVTVIREASGFGGGLTGQVVVNNRAGLSTAGELSAENVDLQQLLSELAGIDRFTGTGGARLKFLASGPSMAALMNSLSGDGDLQTGRGTIKGIDLDKLFRTGLGTGGTTIFDKISATFTIADGDLVNRDLAMALASITASGDGRIGLGKQDIDYLFTPISLKARDGRGIAVPVRIKGPWASPQILPDLEKAIDLNLADEKKALEDKARAKIDENLSDKLGVEKQEGESTEDALKRKAEEEVLKGLGKLLGGN
ncbi:AsmA family protein [Pseudooceanicola sp.]|uniref:AsmA family protein n=1 Tax=Pseudooceanicola sp. TaxID=1914328 RepID=UPI00261F68E6|nr:AsmA family protein [Pseudooceanicola sp.]MDF1855262.1 AsmA family protein [Pseudooceanicola sp.]